MPSRGKPPLQQSCLHLVHTSWSSRFDHANLSIGARAKGVIIVAYQHPAFRRSSGHSRYSGFSGIHVHRRSCRLVILRASSPCNMALSASQDDLGVIGP